MCYLPLKELLIIERLWWDLILWKNQNRSITLLILDVKGYNLDISNHNSVVIYLLVQWSEQFPSGLLRKVNAFPKHLWSNTAIWCDEETGTISFHSRYRALPQCLAFWKNEWSKWAGHNELNTTSMLCDYVQCRTIWISAHGQFRKKQEQTFLVITDLCHITYKQKQGALVKRNHEKDRVYRNKWTAQKTLRLRKNLKEYERERTRWRTSRTNTL